MFIPIPDFKSRVDGCAKGQGRARAALTGVDEFVFRGAIAAEERFNGRPVNTEEKRTIRLPVKQLADGWVGADLWVRAGGEVEGDHIGLGWWCYRERSQRPSEEEKKNGCKKMVL